MNTCLVLRNQFPFNSSNKLYFFYKNIVTFKETLLCSWYFQFEASKYLLPVINFLFIFSKLLKLGEFHVNFTN